MMPQGVVKISTGPFNGDLFIFMLSECGCMKEIDRFSSASLLAEPSGYVIG